MKIAPRLTLISAALFLAVSSVLSYAIYSASSGFIEKDIIARLEERAFHTIDKIDRLMYENITAARVMASDPIIGSPAATAEEKADRLIEFRNLFKSHISISLYDMARVNIADSAGLAVGERREFTDYWPAIAGGEDTALCFGHSEILKRTVIYFASVVKDGTGNRSGVVVARLPIEKLNEILKSVSGTVKVEESIEVDLVDRDGLLIFSSYAKDSILQERTHNWEMIQAYAAEGGETTTFRAAVVEHGRRIEIFTVTMEPGFKDFKGNGWMLILHLPVDTAFASVDRLQLRVVVILLLAGLIGIAAMVVFSYRITLPLKQLAGAAREIGRGNLAVKVDIGGNDEVGELAERFNRMVVDLKNTTDRVAAATAELKDFAYIVSHDLKAPLRAITSLANWLVADYGDKLDEEGRETLRLLDRRAKRMNGLIEGILEYSRVGREQQEKQLVDLEELVREAIELLVPADRVTATIETGLPELVIDRTRIYQVFQNLIGNAVKYLDKPSGEIRVGCLDEGGQYTFYVADNGQGIEEKYFDKVFQIFQTLRARDEVEGTGVGLTIVKKIVEMHGGRIWLKSKIGEGTTFWFTLPRGNDL